MYTIEIKNMNIEQIMDSGQVFRIYKLTPDTYSVMAGDNYVQITEKAEKFEFSCSEEEFDNFWYSYFDLKSDYASMLASIDEDDVFLKRSAEYGRGIRILKQNLWEMMITFIISQQKQIPSIRKCVEALCTRFGTRHIKNGYSWYGFPTAEAIAAGGRDSLADLSLGYRDRYIYETAVRFIEENRRFAAEGTDCDRYLHALGYEEAKAYLMSFCGVGEKVANCICLFGLGRIDAFPIDVHIKDILYREYYLGRGKNSELPAGRDGLNSKEYVRLIEENFGRYTGYRGVIQQWIFAYELYTKRKLTRGIL